MKKPVNRIRFAFWDAEESGLLGSTHYVASLSQEQKDDIMANLSFDMVASPNFARFVYDGDGSDNPDTGPGPVGSDTIESLFNSYFDSRGLAHQSTAFDGRSDYGPFIDAGIRPGCRSRARRRPARQQGKVTDRAGAARNRLPPCPTRPRSKTPS